MAKWSNYVKTRSYLIDPNLNFKSPLCLTHIMPYIEYESRLHPLTFPKIGILSLKSINLRLKDVHSLS